MSSVLLTVQVKKSNAKTASDKVQPGKSGGDEKMQETLDLYNWSKNSMTAKALKNLGKNTIGYIGSNVSVWTGDSYYKGVYQGAQSAINIGMLAFTNPILGAVSAAASLAMYASDRVFTLKWENREATQAARRAGNYLTGNSR